MEEARMVANIWSQAMEAKGDSVTDEYIKLFREHEDCADIAIAEKIVPVSTAEIIWLRLRSESPDAFFYAESDQLTPINVDQVSL